MAQAFKCDKCGKFYTDKDDPLYDEYEVGRLAVCKMNKFYGFSPVDLCATCRKALNNWFYLKEEEDG